MTDLATKFDTARKVGELYMKGNNVTQIANLLGMQRKDAQAALNDWQSILKREAETGLDIKDRVMTVLHEVDNHWALVIKEAWDTVEQADGAGQFGTKTQALKLIASINKDRANMFQQAGVNQDTELVEELNRTQRNQEILVGLLKEIRNAHPEVAEIIARKLSQVQQEVEVVAIESGGERESA